MIDNQAPTIEPDTPKPSTSPTSTHLRQPSSTGSVNGHVNMSVEAVLDVPVARKAVNRFPSGLSQDSIKAPVLMSPSLTTRHRWFTLVRLLGSHLPPLPTAFPQTLTTMAHSPQQLVVVWHQHLHTDAEGPTFISANSTVTIDRFVFYTRRLMRKCPEKV
jgi:hypothetical protein